MLSMIRGYIPEEIKGLVDFYRFPKRCLCWGGPFNGQAGRLAIFESLMAAITPGLILETGTYLGTTTELMAQTGLPLVTVEGNARNYGFARARLRRFRNVQIRFGDSRREARAVIDRHRSV